MDFYIRPIDQKWFDESAPVNYATASAEIGTGTDKKITVTADSVTCNTTIDISVAAGASADLSVTKSDDVISIALGTGTVAGTPDNTKNTATLIAAAISAIDGYTAVASGTGNTAFTATDITGDTDITFSDGAYGTPCPVAGMCLKNNNTYYVCTEADNTKSNNNWRSFSLSTL